MVRNVFSILFYENKMPFRHFLFYLWEKNAKMAFFILFYEKKKPKWPFESDLIRI
jgi:hypothetical protein